MTLRYGVVVGCLIAGCSSSTVEPDSSGGEGGSATACPSGIDDGQAEPSFVTCPDADPTDDACCASTELYCVQLECAAVGCNVYEKVLHACGGELWETGTTLSACPAGSIQELEELEGSACTNEDPCDITTGDGDGRVAVCSGGTWHVYGNPG